MAVEQLETRVRELEHQIGLEVGIAELEEALEAHAPNDPVLLQTVEETK